jgi:transcriptional regulator with XRE-family HTH domain
MNERVQTSFAHRISELCDDMGLPRERGRQTQLAKLFGVSPNAARKWLLGEGMPELTTAVEIADWGGVTINWLLQGLGPKRGLHVDTKALVLQESIESLPSEDGQGVLDFIRYKIERADGPVVGERLARYMSMIDAFKVDLQRKRGKP